MPRSSVLDCNIFDLANLVLDELPEAIPFEDFGPYHLLGPIGQGGMGEVFLAEDQTAGRRVAIKFLRDVSLDPDLRRHFSSEIQMLAKLEHPYIARLYEIGVHPNGTPYSVLEYVEGKPVDVYCQERASSLEARIRLFQLVCEAVQYAHSRAVVHLDLKPSNILVTDDGTPKLIDFGIAKRLESIEKPVDQTQLRYTPAFAAPEQIRREPVGTYTDVYALGVILHLLLAGKHPFAIDGCTPSEIDAIVTGEQEAGRASDSANRVGAGRSAWKDLDVLCLKALKKNVPQRYRSVLELSQDISHFLRGEPLEARPDSLSYRIDKFVRRNRRSVLATSLAVALTVLLVVFFTLRLAKERNTALAEEARTRRIEAFMLNMLEGNDEEAGPANDLRVVTVLDRGVRDAQALSNDPPLQVDLYRTLGDAYHGLGKYDRADSLLQTALAKSKAAFGPDHPEVAKVLLSLGLLRNEQGQLGEAERLCREALAIDRRHFSMSHPAVAEAMTDLGLILGRRGQYDQAIKLLTEAVRLQSTPAGDENILSNSLFYLANAHYYLGHYAISEALNRQVLAIDRKRYGDQHPDVGSELMNLANTQEKTGHLAEAERLYRQALDIFQRWFGEDHPVTADAMSYVGKTLREQGKYDQASILLKRSLVILKHIDPSGTNPKTAFTLAELAAVSLAQGKLDEAEKDYIEVLHIDQAVFGDQHQFTAVARSNLAELYSEKAQYAHSEQLFQEAVATLSSKSAVDPTYKGLVLIKFGHSLVQQKRYGKAETETLAGYEILSKMASPSPALLKEAREDMLAISDALHRPDKAANFRAELAASEQRHSAADTGK